MLNATQLAERRKYICSSDAASIVLGDDGYGRGPSDVFLEKTGRVEDLKTSEAMERGNLLEPVLVEWACKRIGQDYINSSMRIHPGGLIASNFDAIEPGHDPKFHVEAKSTGLSDEYGEEGTDQVPERVLVQIHHAFAVVPTLQVAYVPVLMPGFKCLAFKMYEVPRVAELADRIGEACSTFMEKHVRRDIPPEDFRPSLEILKRVRRQPEKVIALPDLAIEMVDMLDYAKETLRRAKDAKDRADAAVLAMLGDAEGAVLPDGRCLTYMETRRSGYEVKETTYRTLRVKAAKALAKAAAAAV